MQIRRNMRAYNRQDKQKGINEMVDLNPNISLITLIENK